MKYGNGKNLGMDRKIERRDFLGGVAVTLGGLAAAPALALREGMAAASSTGRVARTDDPSSVRDTYPPRLTGLRGQSPGTFEEAHKARDGAYAGELHVDRNAEEVYDLIVVGAGISGLATAYFYRQAFGGETKVLILDNNDDFGGHARRNEFFHGGRIYLAAGGTLDIATPFPYSFTAQSLIKDLGVDVGSYKQHLESAIYKGLTPGVFFDKEHFKSDRLVAGFGTKPWRDFFAAAPLTDEVRSDLVRVHAGTADHLPELDAHGKAEALKKISYQQFLEQRVGIRRESLAFFHGHAYRNNKRIDTCPAYEALRGDAPGFSGMKIEFEPIVSESAFFFHFPDGNATIARLLCNRLVPAAWSGAHDMESISTAVVDYGKLDLRDSPTRVRLNSTAIRVQHNGHPDEARSVVVSYSKNGTLRVATGNNVVLACNNNIIPYIVPELPQDQRAALRYASKVPMQYTNVLLRNWRALERLGVHSVLAPNGYHTDFELVPPVSLGGYRFPTDPSQPIVAHLTRNPNTPGLPRKEQQRLGRVDMLAMPFEKIEFEVRSQMARMFGHGGFDPSRDILAITANRWPHGYAYTYDTLSDPPFADDERPHVIGRRRCGRISIANSDSGGAAFTNVAIDEAARAIKDLLNSRGLV